MDCEVSIVGGVIEKPLAVVDSAVCLLGFGSREVLIDAEDAARCSVFRWWLFRANRTESGDYSYAAIRRAGRIVLLHRFVLEVSEREIHVDHLNGNRLDNRKGNLRACSHAENMQNRKIHRNNTSGFKGVSWSQNNNGWIARCQKRHLGTFRTREEAANAYSAEAARVFSHLAAKAVA